MANEPDAPPFERVLTLATRSEPLTQTDKSQIFAHAATLTLAEYEGASLTNNRLKSLLLAIGKQQETALKCFVASSSESTTTTHSSFISRRLSDPAFGTSSNIVTFERNEGSQPEHTPLLTQAPTCLSGLAQKSIEKLEKIQVKDHEQSPAAEKKIAFVTDKPSTEPKLPKELSSMRFTPSTAVKTAPQGRVIKPTDWDDQQSSDQYEPRTSSSQAEVEATEVSKSEPRQEWQQKPNRKHQFEDASTKKQTKPAQSVSRPESSVEILAAEINALSTDSDDEQDKTKVQVKDTQPRPKYGYGRVRQMFPIDEEELAALAKENASKSSSMPIAAVVSPAVAPESNSPSSKD
ncbi:unnamed protein product [Cercospora beticola]|nr:unnamed protein product [Cercospora beticola]